jgi:hypothetical protein
MMISKYKICCFVVIISMIVLLTPGCTQLFETDTSDPEQRDENAKIILTPIDLFEGDAAKFKNFLGSMSGAFELRYEGKKPNVKLNIDLWKNGEKTVSYGSVDDLFFSSEEGSDVEVIISIDTIRLEGYEEFSTIKVGTIYDRGSSTSSFTIPWDKKLSTYGLIRYIEPLTFNANGSVHVWGMQATSTSSIRTADFSSESLSRLEWALIFTLSFEDI